MQGRLGVVAANDYTRHIPRPLGGWEELGWEGVTVLAIELKFHIVELKFTVLRRIRLEAWSGTLTGG